MIDQGEFEYIHSDEYVMLMYIDRNTGELLMMQGNQKLTNKGKVRKAVELTADALHFAWDEP